MQDGVNASTSYEGTLLGWTLCPMSLYLPTTLPLHLSLFGQLPPPPPPPLLSSPSSSPLWSGACPDDYPDSVCRSNTPLEAHDPPFLYNLHTDPGELYELDPDEYADVLSKIDRVRRVIRGMRVEREKEGGWEMGRIEVRVGWRLGIRFVKHLLFFSPNVQPRYAANSWLGWNGQPHSYWWARTPVCSPVRSQDVNLSPTVAATTSSVTTRLQLGSSQLHQNLFCPH